MALARLACVRHAASVRPEPGSNSPSEIIESSRATRHRRIREVSLSRLELDGPRVTEAHDAEDRSWAPMLLAHPLPGCSISNRRRGWSRTSGKPVRALPILTGFRALTFHTLLSFQGASSDRSSRLPLVVPDRVPSPERRPPYSGLPRFVNRATYRPWSPRGSHRSRPRPAWGRGYPTVGRPRVFPGSRHPPYLLPASSRHMAAEARGDTSCGQ
jgi:hypothetical protein